MHLHPHPFTRCGRAFLAAAVALLALLTLRPTLPASAEETRSGSTYRVRGVLAPGGAFTGELSLTYTGAGVSAHQVVHFSDGSEWSIDGKGVRSGKTVRIAIDAPATGITHALSGKAPVTGKPGTLSVDLGSDTLRSRYSGPDGKADATGVSSDLRWSDEDDLRSGDPAHGTADDILDYWNREGEFGSFAGVDGKSIATAVFKADQERVAVVFAPGRTETFTKYAELVRDLHPHGFSFYFLDHRGQGQSDRIVGSKPAPPDFVSPPGHVDRFDDYVDDVARFVDRVVRKEPHAHVVGWGHSMGGGILTRYAEKHPGSFAALILSSPMHGLPIKWWQRPFVSFMTAMGKRRSYALGKGPWQPSMDVFEGNDTTGSESRYRFKMDTYSADPSVWIGGPTYGWVHEADRAGKAMREDARRLTMPVLLFQAGADTIVDNSAQDAVVAAAPDCTKIVLPGARHELLLERDDVRDAVLDHVLTFLESRLGL